MLIATWIVTGLLSIVYLGAGTMKIVKGMGAIPRTPEKILGLLEILAVIGLIAPVLSGIAPWLTPVSAFALALVQISAIILHTRQGETKTLPVNVVLLLLALFVGLSWTFWL